MAEGLAGQCRFHKKNERMFDIFRICFCKKRKTKHVCLIPGRARKSDARKSVEKAVFDFSCGSRIINTVVDAIKSTAYRVPE